MTSTAHSFRLTRPELASRLLDALHQAALPDGPSTLDFSIDRDRALVDALRASGATIVHELWRMEGSLDSVPVVETP